jgi:hypothetical protein
MDSGTPNPIALMSKVRWMHVLPVAAFVVFLTLTRWDAADIPHVGTLRGLCFALNSPGLFLYQAFLWMAPIRWLPRYILKIRSDHFIFLIGVIFQWCAVGREIDKRRSPNSPVGPIFMLAAILIDLLVIAWGVRLIFVAVDSIFRVGHLLEYIIDGLITLTWAVILIYSAARSLAGSVNAEGGLIREH